VDHVANQSRGDLLRVVRLAENSASGYGPDVRGVYHTREWRISQALRTKGGGSK
jgi:hypothetical protein